MSAKDAGAAKRPKIFSLAAFFAAFTVVIVAAAASGGRRVVFSPKFIFGENLRYQIDTRTTATGKTTTPIADPEGGSKVSQAVNLVVLLNVLAAPQSAAQGDAAKTRFQATYETSSAHFDTDIFDPNASTYEQQYARLEGRSLEFTLGPGGEMGDFEGPPDVLAASASPDSALATLKALTFSAGLPRRGISIGEKWTSEKALAGLPLGGVTWHADSTYLRDEPCAVAPAGTATAARGAETCAVILTRFEISRQGGAHSDATPDDYRAQGLRTSGTLSGSGDSLDLLAIGSGLLVSSTQTSIQDMDYQIASVSAHNSIHHVGHVQTETHINLLPSTASNP